MLSHRPYLHLGVVEAYNGQGSSHNLPIVFVIYGADSGAVTLKRHGLMEIRKLSPKIH